MALNGVDHENQASLNENWLYDPSSGQPDREEGTLNIYIYIYIYNIVLPYRKN